MGAKLKRVRVSRVSDRMWAEMRAAGEVRRSPARPGDWRSEEMGIRGVLIELLTPRCGDVIHYLKERMQFGKLDRGRSRVMCLPEDIVASIVTIGSVGEVVSMVVMSWIGSVGDELTFRGFLDVGRQLVAPRDIEEWPYPPGGRAANFIRKRSRKPRRAGL